MKLARKIMMYTLLICIAFIMIYYNKCAELMFRISSFLYVNILLFFYIYSLKT